MIASVRSLISVVNINMNTEDTECTKFRASCVLKKKEADLSDLSETNRENITAPAIRKIR